MNKKRLLTVLGGNKIDYKRNITPTYGDELYTDPSIEAEYTSGYCTTLVLGGSPTVEESADAYNGSKAQAFTATAQNDLLYKTRNAVSQGWYRFSLFAKRTAGAAGNTKAYCSITTADAAYPDARQYVPITSATYSEIIWTQWGDNARHLFIKEMSTTPFDSVIFDLFSVKAITLSSMLATEKLTSTGDVIATARLVVPTRMQGGMVINLDSSSNPQNFVAVYLDRNHTTNDNTIFLEKVVAGTKTNLLAVSTTYVEGAPLKIIKSTTTYQVFYNGVQVGADQTIEDAGIVNNTLHMQFASDPSVSFRGFDT